MAANVVWLASFPKSGSTWFRLLLANLRSGNEQPVSINMLYDPGFELLTRDAFDEGTLLDSAVLQPDEIDFLRPAAYRMLIEEGQGYWHVKVHEAYRRNRAGEPFYGVEGAHAAIYIVRDPRDIATSLARHFDISVDSAIEVVNSSRSTLSPPRNRQTIQLRQVLLGWSSHVESWLDQTDVPVHVVSYEELQADTASAFGLALRFLGETFDPGQLERAVYNSRFSEVKRQEQETGFRERLSTTAPFFRRGEAGAWRFELTAEQAMRIEKPNRRVMQRLGYECICESGAGNATEETSAATGAALAG